MTQKTRIIQNLGESGLLLPALLNAALAANDRAKYYFTLLQAAAAPTHGIPTPPRPLFGASAWQVV